MSWIAVLLWGGAVGLDATSFPQAMISRPIVAATITGLLLGRPVDGLVIGVLLETFALVILPVGAARYPESGTAAVAAAAAYGATAAPGLDPAALFLAVVFGLVWERVGGASVHALRRFNGWLVGGWAERGGLPPRSLGLRHLAALGCDFVRAALVVAVGAFLAVLLIAALQPYWMLDPVATAGVLAAAGTVMLAAVLWLFGGWGERRWSFLLGVACGFALLLLR